MVTGLKELLLKGAAEFNVSITDDMAEKFFSYMSLLKDWNERVNLTSIIEDKEIIIKHFIDSLSIVPYLESKGTTLADLGTGAGFPGLPVKIVRRDVDVTLMDSLLKRLSFLEEVISTLELENIRTVHGRAEDLGQNPDFREKFDVVTARAVAEMPVLLEYCLPLVKTGGIFIAMKGSQVEEELDGSKKALSTLGGEIVKVDKINLPDLGHERNIILIKKFRQTPTGYPRKAGKPSKSPLK
ncbi:MAG TPA: 16S rRNA (guanine(527)-N(7))-methyltransferase RsmG [Clostridiaceae bacterium]|nr:16S rRNA (guanine(527)-N(7))-methyltransferase RsmG [Clostridiaceae bacterium]